VEQKSRLKTNPDKAAFVCAENLKVAHPVLNFFSDHNLYCTFPLIGFAHGATANFLKSANFTGLVTRICFRPEGADFGEWFF
jgi:hypothetical protein